MNCYNIFVAAAFLLFFLALILHPLQTLLIYGLWGALYLLGATWMKRKDLPPSNQAWGDQATPGSDA